MKRDRAGRGWCGKWISCGWKQTEYCCTLYERPGCGLLQGLKRVLGKTKQVLEEEGRVSKQHRLREKYEEVSILYAKTERFKAISMFE